MFSKLASFTVLAAAISSVLGSPVDLRSRTSHHQIESFPKISDWHNIPSLHGFDDFWGRDNFIGVSKRRVILKQRQELVCHRRDIVIIQQRLVVLQELAKRIITEQICEVETQTFVFEQFHAGLGSFRHDLDRSSGHQVGFDARIAGLWGGLFNHDGSLSDHDLGFRGHHVGKRIIVAKGNNWHHDSSPVIIRDAYDAIKKSGVELEDDVDLSSIESVPDVEVEDPAEAPADDEVDAADAEAADADAADAEAADADGAADDGDNTAIPTTSDAVAGATASASSSSSAAPTATAAANADPATAP